MSESYDISFTPRAGMMFCKVCGAEIAQSAKACPHCGATNKKPFYRRTWVILVLVLIIVMGIIMCVLVSNSATRESSRYDSEQQPTSARRTSEGSFSSPAEASIDNPRHTCGDIAFVLPANYEMDSKDQFKTVDGNAAIIFYEEVVDITDSSFRLYRKELLENLIKEIGNSDFPFNPENISAAHYADCPACECEFNFSDNGASANGTLIIINNEIASKLVAVWFVYDNSAPYDYRSDFDNMMASASREDASANRSPGVSTDFRAVMDGYESFFNEYIAFMQKFQDSDNAIAMMSDYMEFLNKYAETMEALEAIDTSDLSTEDMAYYLEVTNRIQQKLLRIVG